MDIPEVGLDGNVVFEQSAGFGAPVEALFQLALFGLKSSVHGSGADREELLLDFGRDPQALDGPGSHSGKKALSPAEQG